MFRQSAALFCWAALLAVACPANAFLPTYCPRQTMRMAATPPPAATVTTSPATPAPPSTASSLSSQKELLAKISSSPTSSEPSKSAASSKEGISITSINYDGVVPKTESDEYVVLTNNSKSLQDISGYYIYVATTGTQGPTFTFPKGTQLKAGESVRVYTNEIHKENGGYSFGSGKAIWSNSGGLGVLKDGSGKKLGEYKYTTK